MKVYVIMVALKKKSNTVISNLKIGNISNSKSWLRSIGRWKCSPHSLDFLGLTSIGRRKCSPHSLNVLQDLTQIPPPMLTTLCLHIFPTRLKKNLNSWIHGVLILILLLVVTWSKELCTTGMVTCTCIGGIRHQKTENGKTKAKYKYFLSLALVHTLCNTPFVPPALAGGLIVCMYITMYHLVYFLCFTIYVAIKSIMTTSQIFTSSSFSCSTCKILFHYIAQITSVSKKLLHLAKHSIVLVRTADRCEYCSIMGAWRRLGMGGHNFINAEITWTG
jgi:hypothetical protein